MKITNLKTVVNFFNKTRAKKPNVYIDFNDYRNRLSAESYRYIDELTDPQNLYLTISFEDIPYSGDFTRVQLLKNGKYLYDIDGFVTDVVVEPVVRIVWAKIHCNSYCYYEFTTDYLRKKENNKK